jgi:hypothetical protein
MARPTTKIDLIIAANGQFDKLWKLLWEVIVFLPLQAIMVGR